MRDTPTSIVTDADALADSAPEGRNGVSSPPPELWLRVGRGSLAASFVSGSLLLLRHAGVLRGLPALTLLVVTLLAMPSSRQLSRRILLVATIAVGWTPVLWWWHLPVGPTGRSGWLLAILPAVLIGWVAAGRPIRSRARRLVPQVRIIDSFPLLVAAGSVLLLHTRLQVHSGAKALALLLGGWDNSAHFDFVEVIRRHGATIDSLGASPDGTPWKGIDYPQGYHAVVATLMELLQSPHVGSLSAELAGYANASALMLVVDVTMVAAGICALPRLRRRPLLAAPLVALTASAFILGPGGAGFGLGFGNFLLASALVAAASLIAVTSSRVVSPLHVAALGGAAVGVAHGWILLLVLMLPASAVVLLPLRRRRWSGSRSAGIACAVIGMATVLCIWRAVRITSTLTLGTVLTIPGGSPLAGVGITFATILTSLGVCLAITRRQTHLTSGRRRRTHGAATRATWLAGVPITGLAVAVAIAAQQSSASGTLSYYFWKFGAGVELACGAILAIAVTAVVSAAPLQRPVRRLRPVLASGVLALAATQLFGYLGPDQSSFPIGTLAPGAANAAAAADAVGNRQAPINPLSTDLPTVNLAAANRLLAATGAQSRHPGTTVVYVGRQPFDVPADTLGEQWFRALTQTWTERTSSTGMEQPSVHAKTFQQMMVLIRRALAYSSRQLVVVDPELVTRVRTAVRNPALQHRVVT